jgi:K+-transporting ATPase KdpF subunit
VPPRQLLEQSKARIGEPPWRRTALIGLTIYERPYFHRARHSIFCRERSLRAVLRQTLTHMETIIASIIALLLFAYLFIAMIRPEKF